MAFIPNKQTVKFFLILFLLLTFARPLWLTAKNYKGAELRTKQSFTYGRFEVRMKPPKGDGFLASFFTFHDFQSSSEWNEIDIEILGRYAHEVQVTSIGPYQNIRPSHQWVPFNTHVAFHTYAFEWTPDYIAWFVDNQEIYRQTGNFIADFHYPQKIMMNLWNPAWENWAGQWSDAVLPVFAYYDWVSYASYTPNAGDCGSDHNFTLQWKDDFDAFHADRWQKATHTFDGNNCDFTPDNVVFKDGRMILCLTDNDHLGLSDVAPPTMLYAWALDSTVFTYFNENLDSVSANSSNNFRIPGLSVKSAVLQFDRRTVKLEVSAMESGKNYNLVAFNIKDLARPANVQLGQVLPITKMKPLSFPILINAGGNALSRYLPDQSWRLDRLYGHQDGYSERFYDHPSIKDSPNDSLFWSELHEAVTYKIRMPNGQYRLILRLAENKLKQAGQRIFDIVAQGRILAKALDPFAMFGYRKAITLQADSILVQDGILNIYLINRAGVSLLNAIEVYPQQTSVKMLSQNEVPQFFDLLPNYPNPFNGATIIPFKLKKPGNVRIQIFSLRGGMIYSNQLKNLLPGTHTYRWVTNGASGLYFCRVEFWGSGQTQVQTLKMIFLK